MKCNYTIQCINSYIVLALYEIIGTPTPDCNMTSLLTLLQGGLVVELSDTRVILASGSAKSSSNMTQTRRREPLLMTLYSNYIRHLYDLLT